jgi:hypothetical protein
MGALHQVLEIIFEMQVRKKKEKIARRKISFSAHKTHFFFFAHFLFSKLLISYSFETI